MPAICKPPQSSWSIPADSLATMMTRARNYRTNKRRLWWFRKRQSAFAAFSSPPSRLNSSNDTSRPAIALAATVYGLASQTLPGPDLPGKFRLIALTVTSLADSDAPGPQLAQAPQLGWSSSAPARSKAERLHRLIPPKLHGSSFRNGHLSGTTPEIEKAV